VHQHFAHHHAVGLEHAGWLAEDISPVGVTMIRSLLDGVDPHHNFNAGKIVRTSEFNWI
jgi:alkyldihydroxyacetonephosphate synthase